MNFTSVILVASALFLSTFAYQSAIQQGAVWRQGSALMEVQSWQQIDFNFPTLVDRNNALQSGFFFPANVTPIDVDVDFFSPGALLNNKRVFVTTPRFATGVPVTLGYVIQSANGPLIQPYPDYSWHSSNGANCDGITSAFRVAVDECNQMWVIDSGNVAGVQRCQPQILVFNLNTDTLVHRYRFPQNQYLSTSLFISIVLDTNDPPPFGRCTDTKAYIADARGYALIVYDSLMNRSWRIQNPLVRFERDFLSFVLFDSFLFFSLTSSAISKRLPSPVNLSATLWTAFSALL